MFFDGVWMFPNTCMTISRCNMRSCEQLPCRCGKRDCLAHGCHRCVQRVISSCSSRRLRTRLLHSARRDVTKTACFMAKEYAFRYMASAACNSSWRPCGRAPRPNQRDPSCLPFKLLFHTVAHCCSLLLTVACVRRPVRALPRM